MQKIRKGYFVGYSETSKGYRIWYKENNEVSLRRDVIFKDESVVNDQFVEYFNDLNDSNNIDVLSLHKDDPLEHSNKPEGDEVMENKFKPMSEDNNENQEYEQEKESNVIITICETEVILRNHYVMIIQPFS